MTITVPAPRGPGNLRQIADQLERGHTGSDEDIGTHWNTLGDSYDQKGN